jgi:hypothetical protein
MNGNTIARNGIIKWVSKFLLITYVIILGITSLAKLISIFGHQQILDSADFVIPIKIRYLLALAAFVELCVVFNIIWNRNNFYRFLGVNILSSCFLLYHLMSGIQPAHHCPCLGTVGSQLGITERTANFFLGTVAAYMFFSSLLMLVYLVKNDQPLPAVEPTSDTHTDFTPKIEVK